METARDEEERERERKNHYQEKKTFAVSSSPTLVLYTVRIRKKDKEDKETVFKKNKERARDLTWQTIPLIRPRSSLCSSGYCVALLKKLNILKYNLVFITEPMYG